MQQHKPLKPQGSELRGTDPELGHETRDISITGVVAFIVALAFCGIVIFVLLWGVFHFASNYAAKQDQVDMRNPWVRSAETEIERRAQQARTPLNKSEEPGSMENRDMASRVRVSRFPQPRLQSDDVHDLAVMREAEDVYLKQYFVLDKNSGKVNIPISQAMKAVVEKGLPAMQPGSGAELPAAAQGTGIVNPSIQSSHERHQGAVR
jgi:hypothetical protein